MILQRYYEKKGHQKKVLRGGADKIQDMKREFLGMASKAGVNSETVSYGGETFLSSEDVAVNILQLTKEAFRRCQTLSNSKDLAQNAVEIFDKLIGFLLIEHVDYALVCYFCFLNFRGFFQVRRIGLFCLCRNMIFFPEVYQVNGQACSKFAQLDNPFFSFFSLSYCRPKVFYHPCSICALLPK